MAYPQTLAWLLRSQNADGSFGTTLPIPKDKLVSTLSALVALADLPQNLQDGVVHRARTKALRFLYEDTGNWQTGPDMAGFELVLPALLDEAKVRGLPLPFERFMGISAQRDAKIGHIPPRLIYNVKTPLLHSLEYLGNRLDVEAARAQLSPNGSFANSPSATAYFLLKTRDEQANEYIALLLRNRGDGSIPTVAPFEVFEIAWVLYNLARADHRPPESSPLLRYLAQSLTAHAVFALTASAPDACVKAFSWLRDSQRKDGSWGWFSAGTPEETAYAVQALMLAPAEFRAGLKEQLNRAAAYLNETEGEPVIPMWVGKTLYGPTQVVRSAVLSARILLARSEHARSAH